MGFRNSDFTPDNVAYVGYFSNNAKYTLAESWNRVIVRSEKDAFYYFVGNVFSKIGFGYREWFIFIAIVFMAGFCYLIYKHSDNLFFSVLFLVSLSYFYFAMTGLRQTLSLGICFFAFEFACRKKWIPFVIFVFVASLFHSSALIFLLVFLLKYLKIGKIHFFFIGMASIIAVLFPSAINEIVSTLAWNDDLAKLSESNAGLTISGFIIQLSVYIYCYFFVYDQRNNKITDESIIMYKEEEAFERISMNMLLVGVIIQAFAINIANIFRMSMYFSFVGALLIPRTYRYMEKKTATTFSVVVTLVFIIYFLTNTILNFQYLSLFGD